MAEVRVSYHHEGDSWWADSVDVPGFSAAASSLVELREMVREGLAFHLDDPDMDLRETASYGVVSSFVLSGTLSPDRWAVVTADAGWSVLGSDAYRVVPPAPPGRMAPVIFPVAS